jgi:hypothetical protein
MAKCAISLPILIGIINYLIEKFAVREAAIMLLFEIDKSRDNQSLFRIFEGPNIPDVRRYIEQNYAEKLPKQHRL